MGLNNKFGVEIMAENNLVRGTTVLIAMFSLAWNGYLGVLIWQWYGLVDLFHAKSVFEMLFILAVATALGLSAWLLASNRRASWVRALTGVVVSVAPQALLMTFPR